MFPKRLRKVNRLLSPLRNQRGQSLAELGMIIAMFALLSIGTLEIGRTWLVANMITQAAREGARVAALTGAVSRGSSSTDLGLINGTAKASIITLVKDEILGVLDAASVEALAYAVVQDPAAGGMVPAGTIPMVTVTITGHVDYMFNLFGTSFEVDRSVSFRDEGR